MSRRSSLPHAAAFALLAAACGPGTYADIQGTVAGSGFTPEAYYWGGPYLVFTTSSAACEDMAWVKRGPTYETGMSEDEGAPPLDTDMTVLLFTYSETDVSKGNVSLDLPSPVDARLLVVDGGAVTVHKGSTGALVIDEIEKEGNALGTLDVGFDDGSLSGDFEVEWCTNLRAKY